MATQRKNGKASQVREWLIHEIATGNFPRGAILPPERELAESLNVSYMTLRKAVGMLVDGGYLERAHGSGTFVRNELPEQKARKLLGMLIPAWSAPENLDFIMHMSEAAEQSNWLSKVIFARNWEERSIVDAWNSCDALVCMAIRDLTLIPPALLAKFRDHSKPVVVSESNALGLELDCVMDDSSAAMRLLAARIRHFGHRRIAQIEQATVIDGRPMPVNPLMAGVGEYLREHTPEIELDTESLLVNVPRFQMAHYAIRERLLSFGGSFPFTLLFCPLSYYLGALSALHDLGLRVPQDVSVFCYGDRQEADFYRPRPTLLRQSLRAHAFRAMEQVLWRSANPDAPARAVAIEAEFVIGETLDRVKNSAQKNGNGSV